jgi:hypothetical protein
MSIQERFDAAALQFQQAFQAAWTPADIQERGAYAYALYMQALQQVSLSPAQQQVAQAYAFYIQVVQDALKRPEIQSEAAEVYRAYLRTLKSIWMEVDVEATSPDVLAAIGQSILSTAWMAVVVNGSPAAPELPVAPAPVAAAG